MSPSAATDENAAPSAKFMFVICQHGAEGAAKQEILDSHPNLKLAFSRPGFITFKVEPGSKLPEKLNLRSTLARTYGWSLGKVSGSEARTMANELINRYDLRTFDHLHVWQRDATVPGKGGFEPGVSVLAQEIGRQFSEILSNDGKPIPVNQIAKPDDRVFDVVLVEPDQWWIGYHFATTVAGRWPGGVPSVDRSVERISRAYFKSSEAIAWSGISILPGDFCAEIGSAPGGCCELLLELGAKVIGIDPGEMEPVLLTNPNFVHIRRRGHEVKKRDLKEVKWLFADLNMVPNYVLDSVSEIVSHDSIDIKGMILTMKIPDWKLIEDVPKLIQRVRELGFSVVKVRQLAFNRQEFCLVAVKDKFELRIGKKRSLQKQKRAKSVDRTMKDQQVTEQKSDQ
jgi:23S rRNA (cytidine2498-2'-O)-methyltransferase